MALLPPAQWRAAKAIAGIGSANPFLPERIELEKQALGKQFVPSREFVEFRAGMPVSEMFPNFLRLQERGGELLETMREALLRGDSPSEEELEVYEHMALYLLYARHLSTVRELPPGQYRLRPEDDILAAYDDYAADFKRWLLLPERRLPSDLDPDIVFAGFFQIERAFFHIFRSIIGASDAAAELRAAVWQSIFTHDMRRYLRSLYQCLGDVTTLITGPSGTGKELVAQAIAYSRFVEFDKRRRKFVFDYPQGFLGVNLSAITPSLIESELFGHVKGAFTGAISEREGFLGGAKRWSTVFLDEIGELDTQVQVKLLRVLQTREFQRVGETSTRPFVGKIVCATNRDLAEAMRAGSLREDFYFRLCSDRVETPSLRLQLQQSPKDLPNFVRFIATRLLPELPDEVETLTTEVVNWIESQLGTDYGWPGNIRELEQCVRSIMIRGAYVPTGGPRKAGTALQRFLQQVEAAELDRKELLRRYCSLVYARCGSYNAAARELGIVARTVKSLVDEELVQSFREE